MTKRVRPGRSWLPAAALTAVLAGPAQAVTPEQFAALEPEEALRLPALEAIDVFGWSRQEFVFVLENALIDLRYLYRTPSGRSSAALTGAVQAFQKDIGQQATGTILVGQFLDLIQRGNEFWQAPIVPGPAIVTRQGDVVSAEGTWLSPEKDEPNPIQTTAIRCYRAAGICAMITARLITDPQGEGWYHSAMMDLDLEGRDWSIVRWSDERIEAQHQAGPCITYRLTIEVREERVTMAAQPTGAQQCREEAAASRTYALASGYEVAARYWEERRERTHTLRSRAFQALTQKIQSRGGK